LGFPLIAGKEDRRPEDAQSQEDEKTGEKKKNLSEKRTTMDDAPKTDVGGSGG